MRGVVVRRVCCRYSIVYSAGAYLRQVSATLFCYTHSTRNALDHANLVIYSTANYSRKALRHPVCRWGGASP